MSQGAATDWIEVTTPPTGDAGIERALSRLAAAAQRCDGPARRAFLARAIYALEELTSVEDGAVYRALAADSHLEVLQIALEARAVPAAPARRRAPLTRELLHREGELLSAEQVAGALGVSRQAVNKRRREGKLIAARVGRGFRYPSWQFGDDGRPLPGLEAALAVLEPKDPAEAMGFFLTETARSRSRRPIDWLREGKLEIVLAAAGVEGMAEAVLHTA